MSPVVLRPKGAKVEQQETGRPGARDRGVRRFTFGSRIALFVIGFFLLVSGFMAGVWAGTTGLYHAAIATAVETAGKGSWAARALGVLAAADAEAERHGAMRPSSFAARQTSILKRIDRLEELSICTDYRLDDVRDALLAHKALLERQTRAADIIVALHKRRCSP